LWRRADSQEVGLEAAILERVRNSSLVEWHRAENVPGLKPPTEAADGRERLPVRGAAAAMVGERSGVAEKPEREHWWSEPKRECRNE
jgi:hypothetical protein